MYTYNNKSLRDKRRQLRNNCTQEEYILWQMLRRKNVGVRFTRQFSIGPYIVDFCCRSKKIIIEIDGHQHRENKEYDDIRTEYFESLGFKVLRFWNEEIKNDIDTVLNKIKSLF